MHLQPYGVQRWGAPADFCLYGTLPDLGRFLTSSPTKEVSHAERLATPNSAVREKTVRAGRYKLADSLGDIRAGGANARINKFR